MQRPLFDRRTAWVATPPSRLPSWVGAKRVAIDTETHDPDLKKWGPGVRRGGKVVGVSFAIEGGPAHYAPVGHDGGGNVDAAHAWAYLRDQAATFAGEVVGANLSYDLDYLAEAGVVFPEAAWFRDVLLAAPLLDELQALKGGYSLQAVAKRAGFAGKSEDHLEDAAIRWDIRGGTKAGLWELPARHVAEYAIQDAALPLQLLRWQEKRIEVEGLGRVWDLESRLLPVLVRMRRRGVAIDVDHLEKVQAWAETEEEKALAVVREVTGAKITTEGVWKEEWVTESLACIGIKAPLTETGKPQTNADFLEEVDHDVARMILRARKMNKLRTTFCESVKNHMVRGRIHCVLNQLRAASLADGDLFGAKFGRMSSSHPNLQQQPARDPEIGKFWRMIYVPDDGKQWASCDFSGQEPRMTVHYAALLGLRGARELAAKFHADPDLDLHQQTADLCGIKRKEAKTIFLGLCYGMGGGKLCASLGLPTQKAYSKRQGKWIDVAGPEGQRVLDKFDAMVPFVRALSEKATARAKKMEFVRTLYGRKCRFPVDEKRSIGGHRDIQWAHKALNRVIQGSSADQTKAAMVEVDKAGHELQLQVHDELCLSVRDREQAEDVARIMRDVVSLSVPSKVDVDLGSSWGDSMKE